MHRLSACTTCVCLSACLLVPQARAQVQIEHNPYRQYGATQVSQYRVGTSITATKGAVQNIKAMVAIPFECDEQDVKIIEEDVTSHCEQIEYRLLREGGARQLLVSIHYLGPGEEAHALITFEVSTRTLLPPEDTSALVIPVKPDRQLKRYLGRSPFIETNHAKIKKVARQIFADLDKPPQDETQEETAGDSGEGAGKDSVEPATTETAEVAQSLTETNIDVSTAAEPVVVATPKLTDWQRVEAIYDYVLAHVEYVEGDDKSAVQTLRDAKGDCQNISALFIALCRTNKIPARIVWVHEHNYAEFCLQDATGQLHWFPVESAGTHAFGHMPFARTILQKGDNFSVPERPRTPLRYASNFMVAEGVPGSGKPRVRYIQEQL